MADWRTGRGQEVEEGWVGWMNLDPSSSDDSKFNSGSNGFGRHKRRSSSRTSSISSTSMSMMSMNGSISSRAGLDKIEDGPMVGGGDGVGSGNGIGRNGLPLPQQPKEIQIKGVRACRECWAVVSYVHLLLLLADISTLQCRLLNKCAYVF